MPREIIPYNPKLKERARRLRRNLTPAETLLWKQLRRKQCRGLDFDRQRPLGEYIVDFYCKDLRLAIEVDGQGHEFKNDRDDRRTRDLEKLGVTVLRFWNAQVTRDVRSVLDAIEQWIDQQQDQEQPRPSDQPPS